MLTARLYIKRESAEAYVVNEETVCHIYDNYPFLRLKSQ